MRALDTMFQGVCKVAFRGKYIALSIFIMKEKN